MYPKSGGLASPGPFWPVLGGIAQFRGLKWPPLRGYGPDGPLAGRGGAREGPILPPPQPAARAASSPNQRSAPLALTCGGRGVDLHRLRCYHRGEGVGSDRVSGRPWGGSPYLLVLSAIWLQGPLPSGWTWLPSGSQGQLGWLVQGSVGAGRRPVRRLVQLPLIQLVRRQPLQLVLQQPSWPPPP